MLWTDLLELKAILEIHPLDKSEDKKLNFFNEWSSEWLEQVIGRDLTLKSRTQFYGGQGTQKILLRNRPVFPNIGLSDEIQVFLDESGNFGSTSGSFDPGTTELLYGDDFALDLDQDDGSSRSAILWRLGDLWPRPAVRQRGLLSPFLGPSIGNVKVVYTAGYTADTLPAQLRLACNLLVARLRYIFPLGMELGGEGYEERSINLVAERDDYILSMVKPMVLQYRNWTW